MIKWRVCIHVFDSKTKKWYYESKVVGAETLRKLKEVTGGYIMSYSKEDV